MTVRVLMFLLSSISCLLGSGLSFRAFVQHAPAMWLRFYGGVVLCYVGLIYAMAALSESTLIPRLEILHTGLPVAAGVFLISTLQIAYYIGGRRGR